MRVEPRGVARVLASAAVSAAVVALLSAPAAGPGALRLGSSAGTSVATLTYGDFLELDGIKKFLGDEGLANASSYDELSDLVPREIVTRVTRDRAEGVVGVAASLGYVAFGLSRSSPRGGTTAAYVLVMDYRGAVVALSPTLGKVLRQKGWSDADERELYKPLAIKPYNSSALLVALSAKAGLKGPRALWHWRANTWTVLCDGRENDAHDAQWAYSGDALWQADGYTVIKKYDAATGRELAEFAEHRVEDPNHVQLIEEDSLAFVSSRSTNGIVKEDAATGDVVWVLGGEHGKFDIVDERGHNHTAGSNYFLGQHNAEYFGDDEYCLFDNQKGSAKSSRLLCLRLDEAEGVATVTFIYSLGSKTPHFGDNDRLPTGNFLGLHWPDTVDYDDQFEVRVIEVENDGDVAMEIKVAGDLCRNATGCYRDDYGWTSYSAERFYDAPLVYETTCGLHAVSFKTVNNFKQNDLANGTYAVRVNGDERKSGAFSFKPHWRPQDVTVDGLGTLAANDVVILRVANAWGDESSTTLDCAPGA